MSRTDLRSEYGFVRGLVKERSAISLDEAKDYLVEARLISVARELGFSEVPQLIEYVRTSQDDGLVDRLVEAIATNETSWFRDPHVFESLKASVIPDLLESKAKTRSLGIWSAGCSTGQEIYSIAMLLDSCFPVTRGWDVTLFGSDISSEVISRAKRGSYTELEIGRGLDPSLRDRYFDADGRSYVLRDEIRRRVRFERVNLLSPRFVRPGWDLIALRNVLIYFDRTSRRTVLAQVHRRMEPNGYLLLGAAETVYGHKEGFEKCAVEGSIFYRWQAGAARSADADRPRF